MKHFIVMLDFCLLLVYSMFCYFNKFCLKSQVLHCTELQYSCTSMQNKSKHHNAVSLWWQKTCSTFKNWLTVQYLVTAVPYSTYIIFIGISTFWNVWGPIEWQKAARDGVWGGHSHHWVPHCNPLGGSSPLEALVSVERYSRGLPLPRKFFTFCRWKWCILLHFYTLFMTLKGLVVTAWTNKSDRKSAYTKCPIFTFF